MLSNLTILENYLAKILAMDSNDIAINGIQVANSGPIKKIISAVDFSKELLDKVIPKKPQLILVHHGIYWGHPFAITNRYYHLISGLIKNNIALVAIHLPLDINPKLGNNILILKTLDLTFKKTFGNYKGMELLFQGNYSHPLSLTDFKKKVEKKIGSPISVVDAKKKVKKVGVCSGGGHFGLIDAFKNGCDTFITGDAEHTSYHLARELGINLIQAGHYNTEVFGVQALGKQLAKKYDLEHEFIDLPTGL